MKILEADSPGNSWQRTADDNHFQQTVQNAHGSSVGVADALSSPYAKTMAAVAEHLWSCTSSNSQRDGHGMENAERYIMHLGLCATCKG